MVRVTSRWLRFMVHIWTHFPSYPDGRTASWIWVSVLQMLVPIQDVPFCRPCWMQIWSIYTLSHRDIIQGAFTCEFRPGPRHAGVWVTVLWEASAQQVTLSRPTGLVFSERVQRFISVRRIAGRSGSEQERRCTSHSKCSRKNWYKNQLDRNHSEQNTWKLDDTCFLNIQELTDSCPEIEAHCIEFRFLPLNLTNYSIKRNPFRDIIINNALQSNWNEDSRLLCK